MNEQQKEAFKEAWRNIEDNEEKDYEVAESMWNKAATEVAPDLLSQRPHNDIFGVIERVHNEFGPEAASSLTIARDALTQDEIDVKEEDILVKDPNYKGPHIPKKITSKNKIST